MIILRQRSFTTFAPRTPDKSSTIKKPISDPRWEEDDKEFREKGYKNLGGYADSKYRFYQAKDGKVIRVDKKTGTRKEYPSIYETTGYLPLVFDAPMSDVKKYWREEKKRYFDGKK